MTTDFCMLRSKTYPHAYVRYVLGHRLEIFLFLVVYLFHFGIALRVLTSTELCYLILLNGLSRIIIIFSIHISVRFYVAFVCRYRDTLSNDTGTRILLLSIDNVCYSDYLNVLFVS